MENEKNNNSYDNESYLNKRENPVNDTATPDLKKDEQIKPIENIDSNESADNQKEMHIEIDRKKSKDFTKPLVLGVISLIVVGVLAVVFLMPLINVQKKETPQQIIKSSTEAMQKVKTYSYDGIMELDIENKETSENFNFSVELSGKDDITDINNIKSSANLKLVADVDMDGGSQEFSFDLDAIQFGQKKTYLKINDFDLGMLGMMLGPEVNNFKEKWYKLDLEELEKLGATSSGGVSGASMATYDLNKIMELYNKYELLKFEEDLGDIKMGGFPSIEMIKMGIEYQDIYHYKVKLDGIALANFYMDVMKEMISEINSEDKVVYENFKEIRDDIKKFDYVINDITNNINVEIWIGKEDKLIYRTKIDGKFDKEFMEMISDKIIKRGDNTEEKVNRDMENMGDSKVSFYIDVSMFDFNQPVEINEPEGAENLVEVLEGMLGGFMGTGALGGTELDTDADGLPDYMEEFYGTAIDNPDTDGDGYTDGEEIESGYDPLVPGSSRLDYEELFK